MMRRIINSLVAAAALIACVPAFASPYIGTGDYFLEPGSWNVGDLNSTFQAWDNVTGPVFNLPDAGLNTNPAIATPPTLSAQAPAFPTGSGNFYAFAGPYGVSSDIYNHNLGGTDGTHVIVQTTATTNNSISVLPGTLEIVDHGGAAVPGGANASALVDAALVAAGTVNSSFGPVNLDVRLWEFFLPGYTGDFRVQWTEQVDSSFDQLRVDSKIAQSALPLTPVDFTPIPEPATLCLSLLGLASLAVLRRR